jgi:hypothetical protein
VALTILGNWQVRQPAQKRGRRDAGNFSNNRDHSQRSRPNNAWYKIEHRRPTAAMTDSIFRIGIVQQKTSRYWVAQNSAPRLSQRCCRNYLDMYTSSSHQQLILQNSMLRCVPTASSAVASSIRLSISFIILSSWLW